MIVILLMAVDFGRLFFSYVQVTNGAREGAAYGIAHPEDTAGIQSRALQETSAQAQRGEGLVTVTTTCSPSDCATSYSAASLNQVKVTVSERFTFLTPLISNLFSNLSVTASATSVAIGAIGIPAPTLAPTPTPTSGPTPTATPVCITVPNVNGMTPANADTAITAVGLVANGIDDLTTGQKQSAKNQSPAAGTCVAVGSTVTYHYRP